MPPGNFRSHLPPRRDCVTPGMNEQYDKAEAVVARLDALMQEVETCRVARDLRSAIPAYEGAGGAAP